MKQIHSAICVINDLSSCANIMTHAKQNLKVSAARSFSEQKKKIISDFFHLRALPRAFLDVYIFQIETYQITTFFRSNSINQIRNDI